MKKAQFLIFWAVIGFFGPAIAQSYDLQTVIGNMDAAEKKIVTIRFHYKQTFFYVASKRSETMTGEAQFKKPDLMKLKMTSPRAQLTVSNGKKVWIYNPAYRQVWTSTTKDWAVKNNLPKGMIPVDRFVTELQDQYDLSLENSNAPTAGTVTLLARSKLNDDNSTLTLLIDTMTWMPLESEFKTETATIVTSFSDYDMNKPMTEADFTFQPPKGTDVVPF